VALGVPVRVTAICCILAAPLLVTLQYCLQEACTATVLNCNYYMSRAVTRKLHDAATQ